MAMDSEALCLESGRLGIGLGRRAYVDASDFLALTSSCEQDDDCRAIELWTGTALSGGDTSWANTFRNFVELRYRLALERAVPYLSELGRHAEARYYAQVLVNLDPFDEHARRIAIGAAIRSHHTLDAERHYLEIVQLLQNELDVTPERETIDLYQKGLRSDR